MAAHLPFAVSRTANSTPLLTPRHGAPWHRNAGASDLLHADLFRKRMPDSVGSALFRQQLNSIWLEACLRRSPRPLQWRCTAHLATSPAARSMRTDGAKAPKRSAGGCALSPLFMPCRMLLERELQVYSAEPLHGRSPAPCGTGTTASGANLPRIGQG